MVRRDPLLGDLNGQLDEKQEQHERERDSDFPDENTDEDDTPFGNRVETKRKLRAPSGGLIGAARPASWSWESTWRPSSPSSAGGSVSSPRQSSRTVCTARSTRGLSGGERTRVDLEAPGLRVLEKTIFSLAARGSAFSTITAVLGVGLGRSKDNRPLYYSDGNCRVQSGDFGLSGGLRGDPGTAPVGASSRHRNGIMPDAHCSCGAIT